MGIVASVLKRFHGGVHPPDHKALSENCAIEPLPLSRRLFVPLHQHLGSPCEPCVTPGQQVLKGELLGRTTGFVSAPVHAPTSGTVAAIVDHPVGHPSGLTMPCVVLDSDGQDRWHPDLKGIDNPMEAEPLRIRDRVREAGIVGLGGATFPSFIKLTLPKDKAVELLLINGVECEPYLTCDARLMEERSRELVEGIRIMLQALQAKDCVIGIEDNKPAAIRAMQKAVKEQPRIRVASLPVMYPQGSEKQLIEAVTGRQVPSGALPIDVGVIVHNVATATAVRDAVLFGHPLVQRLVTVTGGGITRPANLEVRIGTPVGELIDHCGGLKGDVRKVVMGGPMMGVTLGDLQAPVVKGTSGILVMVAGETVENPEQACIRCGSCVQACPISLVPCEMAWFSRNDLFDELSDVHIFDCIECGSCAYVCPANIPLVHYFRYGKLAIHAARREKQQSELGKARTKAKEERVAREQAEKERKKAEMKAAAAAKKAASAAGEGTPGAAPAAAPAAKAADAVPNADDKAARAARAAKAAQAARAAKAAGPAADADPEEAADRAAKAAMAAKAARAARAAKAAQAAKAAAGAGSASSSTEE